MQNDSVAKTLIVAAVLCIVCSVLVSGAAVGLKPRQTFNKNLDIKKNILQAAGLVRSGSVSQDEILSAFEQVKVDIVDLATGEITNEIDVESYDQKKASKDPELSIQIDPKDDFAGIKRRAKYAPIYRVMKDGKVDMFIIPVSGKGLWSTLYGFIALASDTRTVKGIGFYQHGETPGLGGEVDNISWKESWKGKLALNESFEPELRLIKGRVQKTDPEASYKIDGLSGATITSVGVSGLVKYWLGKNGFGPYLAKQRG